MEKYSDTVTYILANNSSYYSYYFYKKNDASGDYIYYEITGSNISGTYRKK